jgi:hypothetical protein
VVTDGQKFFPYCVIQLTIDFNVEIQYALGRPRKSIAEIVSDPFNSDQAAIGSYHKTPRACTAET